MEKKILFAIVGGVVALILAIILLSSGGSKQQGSGSFVEAVVFARGVTEEREIVGDAVELFTTNDPEIFAVVSYAGIPANSVVKYEWEDMTANRIILSEERAVQQAFTGNSTTKISKSSGQWGTGEFALRVYVNGALDASAQFSVKTPQQISQDRFLSILGDVVFTTGVDLAGRPTANPAVNFTQDAQNIYASVGHKSAPVGTEFTLRWRYLPDDRTIKTFTKKVEGDGVFAAQLSASADSWLPSRRLAKGKYTMEILINNQAVKELGFTVD